MGAIAGVVLVGALLSASPVAAATPYGTNLVKNPGAENGLHNWDTFPPGDFQVLPYGPAGFGQPSKASSKKIGGGAHFFSAGAYDMAYGTCPDANQQFTLTGIGSAIDTGHVAVRLQGYMGTNGAAGINAHLDLYFRNSQNHGVASNGITKKVSMTNELYKHVDVTKVLPKNTRILRIHMWSDGYNTINGDCAAFWDKLSVTLSHV
jgi:hypothetical protein